MNSPVLLQDSGLPDSRLLARLIEAGILVLDENDTPLFASAGACELLGAGDEDELRARWPALASQLRIAQWPRHMDDDAAYHGRADIGTPRGPRAIRYEMHVVGGVARSHRALLVRDRAQLLASDAALLRASEAEVNRHVLTGLVHAAKGPLNNFNLTLALLGVNLGRGDATGDAAAKRARYVDVLQNEATRLAACIEEIHGLTMAHEARREPTDIAALSQECVRVLRHGATMREVSLDVDVAEDPMHAEVDPHLVRLALLSLAISLIDLTEQAGRVGWRVTKPPGAPVRVALTTSQTRLPLALVTSIFRLSGTAESAYCAAITARLIVEAQGGEIVVHDGRDTIAGIHVVLPAAQA